MIDRLGDEYYNVRALSDDAGVIIESYSYGARTIFDGLLGAVA